MKTIYTEKEKAIRSLQNIIQTYAWKIKGYQSYDIGYSPFHWGLAKLLYGRGYRKIGKAK